MRSLLMVVSAAVLVGCGEPPEMQQLRSDVQRLEIERSAAVGKADDLSNKVLALEQENRALQNRVSDLEMTAPVIFGFVSEAVSSENISEAERNLNTLLSKFPDAQETVRAKQIVADLKGKIERQRQEAQRLASLGFKALKTPGSIDNGSVNLVVGAPSVNRNFVFDRYDDRYHYYEPDREHKHIVAKADITAATGVNNPKLPGIALYWADGENLRKLGDFEFRFYRWESYATYLGNYSDSRNDFAKTAKIPFSIGIEVSDENIKNRPLYIVATSEGCLDRDYNRFSNPPVRYFGVCSDLKQTLTLEDFSEQSPKVVLLRRMD